MSYQCHILSILGMNMCQRPIFKHFQGLILKVKQLPKIPN